VSATGNYLQLRDGRFLDDRWVGGRWDLSKFAAANGETDWDAVSGRAAAWLAHSIHLRIQCAGALMNKNQDLLLKASHVTGVVRWCLLARLLLCASLPVSWRTADVLLSPRGVLLLWLLAAGD
jgi:hypothetical protein